MHYSGDSLMPSVGSTNDATMATVSDTSSESVLEARNLLLFERSMSRITPSGLTEMATAARKAFDTAEELSTLKDTDTPHSALGCSEPPTFENSSSATTMTIGTDTHAMPMLNACDASSPQVLVKLPGPSYSSELSTAEMPHSDTIMTDSSMELTASPETSLATERSAETTKTANKDHGAVDSTTKSTKDSTKDYSSNLSSGAGSPVISFAALSRHQTPVEDSPAASATSFTGRVWDKKGRKIPHSMDEADEADRLIVEMRDARDSWRSIEEAWEVLTGCKPSKGLLSNRYKRMKQNFLRTKANTQSQGTTNSNVLTAKSSNELESETKDAGLSSISDVAQAPLDFHVLAQKLNCDGERSLIHLILSPKFLGPWADFRDRFLLITKPCGPPRPVTEELESKILGYIKDPGESPYDWPEEDEVRRWKPLKHYGCLLYKLCKTFAGSGGPLRLLLQKKGAAEYVHSVASLIYSIESLYFKAYQSKPSDIVRGIEDLKPTKNAQLSPIPYVRTLQKLGGNSVVNVRRYALMNAERLLKKSMDKELLWDFVKDGDVDLSDLKPFVIKVLARAVDTSSRDELYEFIDNQSTRTELGEARNLALRTLPGIVGRIADDNLEWFIGQWDLEDQDAAMTPWLPESQASDVMGNEMDMN